MTLILTYIGSGLLAIGGILFGLFHRAQAKADVADAQADAAKKVADAQADRDKAIVAVEQARNVISKANEAAAQSGVDAAKERANVEHETSAAPRADNLQWMRDNGFIRDAGTPNEDVGRGAGGAGSDPNR